MVRRPAARPVLRASTAPADSRCSRAAPAQRARHHRVGHLLHDDDGALLQARHAARSCWAAPAPDDRVSQERAASPDPKLPPVPAERGSWRAEDDLTRESALLDCALPRRGRCRRTRSSLVRRPAAAVHDPYTILFHPQEFKGFNAFLGGEHYGGIGVVFARRPKANGRQ